MSGALKTVAVSLTKIANDIRYLGSGPRAGLAEIALPELQKGSSIMPGKVNPVIPEVVTQVAAQVMGNDVAITVGGMQGHFELNVFVPLLARNMLDSVKLLASACRLFAEKCVDGIEAQRENAERYAELTLSAATALNPYIGYDRASEIVKEAAASGRSLREVAREKGVEDEILDRALDYRAWRSRTNKIERCRRRSLTLEDPSSGKTARAVWGAAPCRCGVSGERSQLEEGLSRPSGRAFRVDRAGVGCRRLIPTPRARSRSRATGREGPREGRQRARRRREGNGKATVPAAHRDEAGRHRCRREQARRVRRARSPTRATASAM